VGNVGHNDAANGDEAKHFPYRSSMYITGFFQELDTEYEHDGSRASGGAVFRRLRDLAAGVVVR